MSKLATQQATAAKWMDEGIKQHEECRKSFQRTKKAALTAGYFFHCASEAMDHGDWEQFIAGYSGKVSRSAIYSYMRFFTDAVEWVKANQPALVGMQKLLGAACDMVMQSPKGFVALCRDLGEMRKFGEYDAVKYARKKLGNEQIEFDFAKVVGSLEVLTHFGDDNCHFIYPEGADEVQYMSALETKLETALKRVRQVKQNGKVIDA